MVLPKLTAIKYYILHSTVYCICVIKYPISIHNIYYSYILSNFFKKSCLNLDYVVITTEFMSKV